MGDAFPAGTRVRATRTDPPHHTRVPRYVRGAVGVVVGQQGHHPLADDRARGRAGVAEPVYTVRFAARQLFGEGDHAVTVALWHSYLQPAGRDEEEAP